MEKITFKLAYLFAGTAPRTIELKKIDKNGNVEYINNAGAVMTGEPLPNIEVQKLTLFTTETFKWQGEDMKRVVGFFSYYLPEEAGHIEGSAEKAMNQIYYEAHRMLKTHQNVAVKDEAGNDVNPNRYGTTVKFELIEESLLVKNQVEKNNMISDALREVKDLYESDKDSFIDFCYAYGIRPILNVPVENLYNEAMFKIQINPKHFFTTKEMKDRDIMVVIKKALEIPISEDSLGVPKTLISVENDKYYMDGEIIASNEPELVSYLKTHPKQKSYIMSKLNIEPITSFPVIEVTTESPDTRSGAKNTFDKKVHAERIAKMNAAITLSFTKYNKALLAKPEDKGKLLKELDEDLNRKRDGFIDVVDYFDDRANKEKSYLK